MCWVAAIPMIMTAVSGIMSAMSAADEAAAKNQALEYNAASMRQNADNERYEAKYAREQALRNAQQKQRETAVLLGTQRARMGASGVVVDSGSFLDVLQNTAAEGARDAMGLMQEGDIAAWRHEVKAGQYENDASMVLKSKQDPNAVLAGGLIKAGANTAMSAYGMSGFLGGGAGAAAAGSTATVSSTYDRALAQWVPAGARTPGH